MVQGILTEILSPSNADEIGHIILAQTTFQDESVDAASLRRLAGYTYQKLTSPHNFFFGVRKDGRLATFSHFEDWNDDLNYNLGLTCTDPAIPGSHASHPLISDETIAAVNAGVEMLESLGRSVCWTIQRADKPSVSVTDIPACLLSNYSAEIFAIADAGEHWPWAYDRTTGGPKDWRSHLIPTRLEHPQNMIKMVKNDQTA